MRGDLGDRAVHRLGVGHVALHAEQTLGDAGPAMRDGDLVTISGQALGDRQADAAIAAGDKNRAGGSHG